MEKWTKHQNIACNPAHSTTKQGSRYSPLVCPSKQSSGVCRGFVPDIQVCSTQWREDLVNATITSNTEEDAFNFSVPGYSCRFCYACVFFVMFRVFKSHAMPISFVSVVFSIFCCCCWWWWWWWGGGGWFFVAVVVVVCLFVCFCCCCFFVLFCFVLFVILLWLIFSLYSHFL